MLSKYFEIKTNSKIFDKSMLVLLEELKNKKVLVYGAGEGFFALNKKYDFYNNVNITAIADKKFEVDNTDVTGLKQVKPEEITKEDFDVILISNENYLPIEHFLVNKLGVPEKCIFKIFKENIVNEVNNFNYLMENKFDKNLPKLVKKLDGKRVLIHGADEYFELINSFFDLAELNIIGITDFRFENEEQGKEIFGYKIYKPSEIFDVNPDFLLVSSKYYMHIIEYIYYNSLKGSQIKIKPLVKKGFVRLLKEVASLEYS